MKQLRYPLTLKVLPIDKSLEYAASIGLWQYKGDNEWQFKRNIDHLQNVLLPRLPDVDENYIDIFISHMIDCGHFWCQHADQKTQRQLTWLSNMLNKGDLPPLMVAPTTGMVCAAPYRESERQPLYYYRAKIEQVLPDNKVWVFYIDYGNNAMVQANQLRGFGNSNVLSVNNALAFEATLTEVAPSLVKDDRARWTDAAMNRFASLTEGKKLLGKVFSVAMSVVSLELILGSININKILIEEGHAQMVDESYLSKLNRDLRESTVNMQPNQKNALNNQQKNEVVISIPLTVKPPNLSECTQEIHLKGPFSPLESKVHSLMYIGKNMVPNIEWNSVNSVILNTDPQDCNERLLVAVCADQSATSTHLSLRQTTLMPNIPGLPAIVALAFCPTAELRINSVQRNYAAALCGLGHCAGRPLFPEQDMLVSIDVDLTNEDLQNINRLRYYMDVMLLTQNGQDTPMNSEETKIETRQQIKDTLQTLISRPRRYRKPGPVSHGWQWGLKCDSTAAEAPNFHGDRAIFPPHNGLVLKEMSSAELRNLAKANQQLRRTCKAVLSCGPMKQTVACTLCQTEMIPLNSMRLHLSSRLHREKEAELPELEEE